MEFHTLKFENDHLELIDQTRLPNEEIYLQYKKGDDVALAIKNMIVRGAPAIGVTAAYALVLYANELFTSDTLLYKNTLDQKAEHLISMRPTAVNLSWAVRRIQKIYQNLDHTEEIQNSILAEASKIDEEDKAMCIAMGKFGAEFIEVGKTYLTHCNAGALATAGQGTALSVFYEAKKAGKQFRVISSETRPFLQGARLTSWELCKNGIDTTLITDNMVAHLMSLGKIDGIVVGSDRIAANGDVANKIGTYALGCLAEKHKIPLYVVAPTSTVDLQTACGKDIEIEERPWQEVTSFFGTATCPSEVKVFNPAFDVTPFPLVTAIISEKGVAKKPEDLHNWFKG